MALETHKVVKTRSNSNMGGNEIYNEKGVAFWFDKYGWLKEGDTLKIETCEKGFTRKVWVNGILKSEDYYNQIHTKQL